MRVISGHYKSRRLKSLDGENTRPTTDKVKESIFNMIGPYFDGGIVLDLYAGSGALAIEAISRGMEQAYCIEKNAAAIKIIKENIAITKEPEKFIIQKTLANQALLKFKEQGIQFDLILLDPPYAHQEIEQQLKQIVEQQLLKKRAWIVCETDKTVTLPDNIESLYKYREALYGITKICIYCLEEENE